MRCALAVVHRGFKSQGVVIDKRALKTMLIGIAGGMTTLVTVLLSLAEQPMQLANQALCALTERETEQILAMLGGKCKGVYNVTLDDVLLG